MPRALTSPHRGALAGVNNDALQDDALRSQQAEFSVQELILAESLPSLFTATRQRLLFPAKTSLLCRLAGAHSAS